MRKLRQLLQHVWLYKECANKRHKGMTWGKKGICLLYDFVLGKTWLEKRLASRCKRQNTLIPVHSSSYCTDKL